MRIKLRKIIIAIQPLVLRDILGGHSTGRGGVGGGGQSRWFSKYTEAKKIAIFRAIIAQPP